MKPILSMLLEESTSVCYNSISYSVSEDFSFKKVLNFDGKTPALELLGERTERAAVCEPNY